MGHRKKTGSNGRTQESPLTAGTRMMTLEKIGDKGAVAIAAMHLIESRLPFVVLPAGPSLFDLSIPAQDGAFNLVKNALDRGGSVNWEPAKTKSGLIFPPGIG